MRAQQYIDSFRSERALGMDAHGAAYLALDEKLARTGAIKTPKSPASPAPGCRQALVREQQALRGLRQPTIVEACEFGAWHAYKAGIVLANITPANIAFDADDNPPVMGLGTREGVKAHNGGAGATSIELHFAPEVGVDESPTVRRYTYSVGLVMFELSTDGRPVRGSEANLDATLQENFPDGLDAAFTQSIRRV